MAASLAALFAFEVGCAMVAFLTPDALPDAAALAGFKDLLAMVTAPTVALLGVAIVIEHSAS